ncbi:MAG: ACT domain-containing protein [Elusimicrobia bacterium]|nr:ACT domain-containing protein [Elusimicrobiota bacterium]
MKITLIKQYSVFLPNQPGALSDLAKRFAERGINIIGLSSEVRDDSALVRVALDGEGDYSAVLSKAGFASVESKMISVEVEDKPGELHKVTMALGEGGVNITNVYGTAVGGQVSRILIAAENTEKALKVLERLG